MTEQFKAIYPYGDVWAVSDYGIGSGIYFYQFCEIRRVIKELEASQTNLGVINVYLSYGTVIQLMYDNDDKERANIALEFIKNQIGCTNGVINSLSGAVYSIQGARGRHLVVYNDRVCITTKVTVGSLLAKNATDGSKDIYYCDMLSVQTKSPKLTIGYIQFETASSLMNNKGDNFFNENTFTYEKHQLPNDLVDEVVNFVKSKIAECKANKDAPAVVQISTADELKKFKELLDMGVITQEEFDAKKKQLLGL